MKMPEKAIEAMLKLSDGAAELLDTERCDNRRWDLFVAIISSGMLAYEFPTCEVGMTSEQEYRASAYHIANEAAQFVDMLLPAQG